MLLILHIQRLEKTPLYLLQFKNLLCLVVQFNQKTFQEHSIFIDPKNLTETTLFSLIWQQMAL